MRVEQVMQSSLYFDAIHAMTVSVAGQASFDSDACSNCQLRRAVADGADTRHAAQVRVGLGGERCWKDGLPRYHLDLLSKGRT